MSAPTREDLPDGFTQVLLGDVAGTDVPPEMSARIKARVLARIAEPPPAVAETAPKRAETRPGFIDVLADSSWQALAPGVEIKILFEDATSRSWMVRLQAGAQLPAHDHDEGQEECLVLEGDVWLGDRHYGAGDYQMAERGTRHARVRSDRGCVMFVRSCFLPARVA
jgi:anti-sigma factor ChrR (cupin superfamily)